MESTFYHVTTETNLENIKKSGLIPQIGPRSQDSGETFPYVYLFDDYGTMEDAAMNWLCDLFDDDEVLVCCEIELPDDIQSKLTKDESSFEVLCPATILPQYIKQIWRI